MLRVSMLRVSALAAWTLRVSVLRVLILAALTRGRGCWCLIALAHVCPNVGC